MDDASDDRPRLDNRRGVLRNRPDEIHRPRANPVEPRGHGRKAPLSDSEGPVLDPVVCIRRVVVLQPQESVRIGLVTGAAETRDAAMWLTEKYSDTRLADRVFELAWTHSQILLRQLNASESDAQGYGQLAGSIIYTSALRRAKASVLIRNRRGQSGLWGYGISGDLPIVLVRIRDRTRIELVRQAVQAHAYWRMKGVAVDLVVWNEDDSVYRQTLQDTIMDLVAASPEAALVDKPGRHLRTPRRADVGRRSSADANRGARDPLGRRRHAVRADRTTGPHGTDHSASQTGAP